MIPRSLSGLKAEFGAEIVLSESWLGRLKEPDALRLKRGAHDSFFGHITVAKQATSGEKHPGVSARLAPRSANDGGTVQRR